MKLKALAILTVSLLVCGLSYGAYYDQTGTNYLIKGFIDIPELSSAPGTPDTTTGRIYTYNDGLYFKDDNGSATNLLSTGTAWDDITNPDADKTITFDNDEITVFSFADINEDMLTIKGVGAFGDVSVVRIEQSTGDATNGTVLEVVAADANVDPLVVSASGKANAFVVGQNTGVVTVAGVAEGTTALSITAGDIALTDGDLNVNGGDASFAEDVGITGNLTVSGTADIGTWLTSSVAPSTGNLSINASGAGLISIGNSSTGAITLTGGGVNIGDGATDTLTITGIIDGDVTIDDGTTDSPKLIFKDSDDEQAEIYQDQSSDDLNVECHDANDSFAVVVGNLSAGTPNSSVISLNGNDLYVADDAEIDGTLVVDTDLDVNGTANVSGTLTGGGTITAATIQATTLLDVDEDVDVDFNANDEEVVITTSATDYAADSAVVTIDFSGAGQTNNTYGLRIQHSADGDEHDHFIIAEDNNGDDKFKVDSGGAVTAAGTITGSGTITGATIQATALLDVDEDVDIDFDAADEEVSIVNSAEMDNDGAQVTIENTDADLTDGDLTANMYLLRLRYTDDGDADGAFIVAEDNNGDDKFIIDVGGAVTTEGDINANGNIVGDGATVVQGTLLDTEVVAAANDDIAAAESGAVFFLNAAGGFQSTLPAPAAGLNYMFVIKTAPSGGDYTIISNAVANIVYGLVTVNGAMVQGAAEDTITFANGNAAIGDWVRVESDGTNWYVQGQGNAAGGITLTQAD